MIRVIHIVGSMNCGGTENLIMNLYRNIDRSLVQFDFLVHTDKECFFDDEIRTLGGRIYHIKRYNMRNLISYRRQLSEFFETHPEYRIMHGHVGSTACIYTKVAKRFGLYTILHSHAINDKKKNLKNFLYRFHAYLAKGMADAYMGCSYEAGVDRYGKRIADSNKFQIINNGINSNAYIFNPDIRLRIRSQFNIADKYVIGHVGRFHPVKNHKFMLDVLFELKKNSEDYVLMLVGDGDLKETIIRQAKELSLEDSIVMTGVRKDVADMLQAMDFFIFPSFNEGLGIGLIEAQASGLPCIANADGITPLAKISELLYLISLKEGSQKWAKFIHDHRYINQTRKDMSNTVRLFGFDISQVAMNLQDFYLSVLPILSL